MGWRSRVAAISILVALVASCSNSPPPALSPLVGVEAAGFETPESLLRNLETSDIACVSRTEFDPTEGTAPDGFEYEKPLGVICNTEEEELYVIVYETLADRHQALRHAEINASLCQRSSGKASMPDASGWFTVVGANWRIATPDSGSAVGQVARLIPGAEIEPISCVSSE